jgi:4'-phosphopantetheinyl transferase
MVNIYYVNISQADNALYNALYAQQTSQRQTRADRYLRFGDRLRCVAAGALLDYAIRQAGGPAFFQTDTNEYGKPFIKDFPEFHFNLSHSGDWVVLATGDIPVGIDVAQITPSPSTTNLPSRIYHPEEQAYVSAGDSTNRFFQIWTRKESYLKYIGTGLKTPLNTFSVLSMENVIFSTIPIEPAYCLTLCATERPGQITPLTPAQLIAPKGDQYAHGDLSPSAKANISTVD